jgi:TAG lipase/steryl ester hydrolase/phospholipase A2/LPA acyltransferase
LTCFAPPRDAHPTPSTLWNIGKSITNPTAEDLVRATKLGELHVWEKLSAIEANCAVEATLDACLARLTNQARARPLQGLSARIPSWLCMNAVGQQVVASWGNPLQPSASALWGPGGWRGGGMDEGCGGAAAAAQAAAAAAHHAHPIPGSPEAMAAAAAAAMAGQARVHYYHPAAGALGALGAVPGGGLLGPAHYPAVHTVLEGSGSPAAAGLGRVPSWGSDAIADSVADFPADAAATAAARAGSGAGGPGAGGHGHHRQQYHHHHHHLRAAVGVCGTSAMGLAGSSGSGASGGATPRSSGSGASEGGLSSIAGSAGAGASGAASSAGGSGVAPAVLAQLECCDPSAGLDLWSSLLPLSSASAALEAAAEGEGLDFIAF